MRILKQSKMILKIFMVLGLFGSFDSISQEGDLDTTNQYLASKASDISVTTYAYVRGGFYFQGEAYLNLDFIGLKLDEDSEGLDYKVYNIINQSKDTKTFAFKVEYDNCEKNEIISHIEILTNKNFDSNTLYKVEISEGLIEEFYKDNCNNIVLGTEYSFPTAMNIKFKEYRNFLTPDLIEALPKRDHSNVFKSFEMDSVRVQVAYFTPPYWDYDFAVTQINYYQANLRATSYVLFYPNKKGNLTHDQYVISSKDEEPCNNCQLVKIEPTPTGCVLGYFYDISNPDIKFIKEMGYNFGEMYIYWTDFKY